MDELLKNQYFLSLLFPFLGLVVSLSLAGKLVPSWLGQVGGTIVFAIFGLGGLFLGFTIAPKGPEILGLIVTGAIVIGCFVLLLRSVARTNFSGNVRTGEFELTQRVPLLNGLIGADDSPSARIASSFRPSTSQLTEPDETQTLVTDGSAQDRQDCYWGNMGG